MHGEITVFAVNRSQTEAQKLEIDVRNGATRLIEATSYAHDDPRWTATADDDTTVVPRVNDSATTSGHIISLELPPVSWNVVRLGRAEA